MNLNWKVLRSGSILATRRNSISTDLRFKSRKLCFSKLAVCIFRTLIFHLGAVCFAGALSKCHTVKGKLLGGVAAGHRDQFSLPARSQSGFLQREFQDPLQAPGDRRIWKFKMNQQIAHRNVATIISVAQKISQHQYTEDLNSSTNSRPSSVVVTVSCYLSTCLALLDSSHRATQFLNTCSHAFFSQATNDTNITVEKPLTSPPSPQSSQTSCDLVVSFSWKN